MIRHSLTRHRSPSSKRRAFLLLAASCFVTAPVWATWSIVAVDTETQEVAVGSATCVTGIDLLSETPAVRVGVGAGAAQSFLDASGQRRQIMFNGFQNGLSSSAIVTQLQGLAQAAFNQHGVADTGDAIAGGDSATDTGASNFRHASGVADAAGNLRYAIQGNVLAGSPVVTEAAAAFVGTAGDMAERLMAAMEAARAFGGDGRCSCPQGPNADSCGSPPASFTKTADVGYMILARYGDTDDPACTAGGCADGDYFLTLNVANTASGDPDPVFTLRSDFDTWRAGLDSVPDAVASSLTFVPATGGFVLRIEPRDWQGDALAAGELVEVTVAHAANSDQATMIGTVVANADGSYQVPLMVTAAGTDVFEITLDDGARQVVLPPRRATLGIVLTDGFESGDTSGWSTTVP